jgi:hypothetical protein
MGVAHEQTPPGLLLQFPNVLADGGLAQAKSSPRFAEVAGLRHGKETFQQYRDEQGRPL